MDWLGLPFARLLSSAPDRQCPFTQQKSGSASPPLPQSSTQLRCRSLLRRQVADQRRVPLLSLIRLQRADHRKNKDEQLVERQDHPADYWNEDQHDPPDKRRQSQKQSLKCVKPDERITVIRLHGEKDDRRNEEI